MLGEFVLLWENEKARSTLMSLKSVKNPTEAWLEAWSLRLGGTLVSTHTQACQTLYKIGAKYNYQNSISIIITMAIYNHSLDSTDEKTHYLWMEPQILVSYVCFP